MARVLRDVVDREGARAAGVVGRGRQDGLLEHQRGAAIAAHAVDHAGEGRRAERDRRRDQRERRAARRAEERERDQRSPASEAIAGHRHDQRGDRGPAQAGADHRPDLRLAKTRRGQVQRGQDADVADRQRAQERGRVQDAAIGLHGGSGCAAVAWRRGVLRGQRLVTRLIRSLIPVGRGDVAPTASRSVGPNCTARSPPGAWMISPSNGVERLLGADLEARAGPVDVARVGEQRRIAQPLQQPSRLGQRGDVEREPAAHQERQGERELARRDRGGGAVEGVAAALVDERLHAGVDLAGHVGEHGGEVAVGQPLAVEPDVGRHRHQQLLDLRRALEPGRGDGLRGQAQRRHLALAAALVGVEQPDDRSHPEGEAPVKAAARRHLEDAHLLVQELAGAVAADHMAEVAHRVAREPAPARRHVHGPAAEQRQVHLVARPRRQAIEDALDGAVSAVDAEQLGLLAEVPDRARDVVDRVGHDATDVTRLLRVQDAGQRLPAPARARVADEDDLGLLLGAPGAPVAGPAPLVRGSGLHPRAGCRDHSSASSHQARQGRVAAMPRARREKRLAPTSLGAQDCRRSGWEDAPAAGAAWPAAICGGG